MPFVSRATWVTDRQAILQANQMDEDDIIQTFMAFRNQRPDKKEEEPLNSCRYVTFFMHILDLANLFRLFIFNLCNTCV